MTLDPTVAFAEMGRIKLGETDLDGVLHRVSELAGQTIPGVYEVSVTLVRDGGAHSAAFTGRLALALDEWQYHSEGGPCLCAAAEQSTIVVADLIDDPRWPEWGKHGLAAGVRSCLSVGLPVQEKVTGAINLYAMKPRTFDDDAVILAQTFAGYAAVALANAHLYNTTSILAEQLARAMESRSVIEQAKGIIMGSRGCSSEEAFGLLSKISQDSNRKLRDVASALVEKAAR